MFQRIISITMLSIVFNLAAAPVVIIPDNGSALEKFAAKELRRYIYLRTGTLPQINSQSALSSSTDVIIGVCKNQSVITSSITDNTIKGAIGALAPQQYYITTIKTGSNRVIWIAGGDDAGVLYGTYAYCEKMGIGFYLDNDVIPDSLITAIPDHQESGKPLFELRGINPFHDFPEGPDWWNLAEYKAVIAQLPKLRMNFIGLHTYPDRGPHAEPTTWIGQSSDVNPDGSVAFSYVSSYNSTLRKAGLSGVSHNWAYGEKRTSLYNYGAHLIFDRDGYGADVQGASIPLPTSAALNNIVFNATGALFNNVFKFAHRYGIKTCIGTETPITVPSVVRSRLGSTLPDTTITRRLYEGIFTRIMRTHPLDYYWLWTPEGWTWGGASLVPETKRDLHIAYQALATVKAPFKFATCGWVLGPESDRAMLDTVMPKDMPMSSINRGFGGDVIDPAYAKITGRSKWAIPWLEDDPSLTIPQFWAKRMFRDGVDALKYGCNGLLGIHWRTRTVSPTISALAHVSWNQTGWNSLGFYKDWAFRNFGIGAVDSIAAIFNGLDGNFPSPVTWALGGAGGAQGGPGSVVGDATGNYSYVARFEKLRPLIKGKGNLDRFDYWLAQFRFTRAATKCKNGVLSDSVASIWKNLLAAVSTAGEMGTIMNMENKNWPAMTNQAMTYAGTPRMFALTPRTSLEKGEDLLLKPIVLSAQTPTKVSLYWRQLGDSTLLEVPCTRIARGVYQVKVPGLSFANDFEYYVTATVNGSDIFYPASAPEIKQTVVVDGIDPLTSVSWRPRLSVTAAVSVKPAGLHGSRTIVVQGTRGRPCAIAVFDGRGKTVAALNAKTGGNTVIPMKGRGAGVYIVKVSWSTGAITVPVVMAR